MSTESRHRLAVYDMDLTLTDRASWTPWLLHWVRHEAPWRLLLAPLLLGPLAGFALGLVDRRRLKEAAHALMMGRRVDAARLERRARVFADRFCARHERPDALAQIARDRAEGFRILLATASSAFYVRHMAARWGIADVVATANRSTGGLVLCRIDGPNCYGADKLALVEAWCRREGIARGGAEVRAYSDHEADVPLLSWADQPTVISPGRRMARIAAARGWPVRRWQRQPGA